MLRFIAVKILQDGTASNLFALTVVISLLLKNHKNERCKVSCCSKECMYEYRRNNGHMVREDNPNWQGGKTEFNHEIRELGLYKDWRDACLSETIILVKYVEKNQLL